MHFIPCKWLFLSKFVGSKFYTPFLKLQQQLKQIFGIGDRFLPLPQAVNFPQNSEFTIDLHHPTKKLSKSFFLNQLLHGRLPTQSVRVHVRNEMDDKHGGRVDRVFRQDSTTRFDGMLLSTSIRAVKQKSLQDKQIQWCSK